MQLINFGAPVSKYTVSYPTASYLLHSVSNHICLHNLQPSYCKHSRSSYFSEVSVPSPSFACIVHGVCITKMLLVISVRRAFAISYNPLIYGKWLVQAYIHTHVYNKVMLVWGEPD